MSACSQNFVSSWSTNFAPIRLGRGIDTAAAHLRAQAVRVGKLFVVDAGSVQNRLAQGQARPGR